MSKNDITTTEESLVISEDVIATIAANAATDVEGVHSMAPHSIGFSGVVFKEKQSKAVKIQMNENTLILDLYIKVKKGYKVKETAEKVQAKVKESVQNMTGYAVTKINVHVADVAFEEAKED